MRCFLLVFLFLVFLSSASYSKTIHVPGKYPTIQDGIYAAWPGDTVLVAPGTYTENIDFFGRAVIVKSAGGSAVTVIDGNQTGTVVQCVNGEESDSVLNGFTIYNGNGAFGGGMRNDQSSPMVMNCVFAHNTADWGGGMYNYMCESPTVINCVFVKNAAGTCGGMRNYYSHPVVVNCTFIKNTGTHYFGGGMSNYDSNPLLANCTFFGNSKGGMENDYGSDPRLTNCILWGDETGEIENSGSNPEVNYCCVQGGWPGTGNIKSDPLFVDADADDFHISYLSPCLDKGINSGVIESEDMEGDPRIAFGTVDMGADEFHPHLYCIGDTSPGGSMECKIIGVPKTWLSGIFFGSGVLDPPQSTPYGDWCLEFPVVFVGPLGVIPLNGVYVLPGTIPLIPEPAYFMQTFIGNALSNLCVLVIDP